MTTLNHETDPFKDVADKLKQREDQEKILDQMRENFEANADATADELYFDAVQELDHNFAYFLTHVLNIGEPKWTSMVPTAAVAVEKDVSRHKVDRSFQFLFNQNFARMCNTEEMAFILGHETMHIILNHLKLCQAKRFDNKMRFNVAADCVINDYLVDMGLTPPEGLCRGEALVGFNAAGSTVTEVYDALPEDTGKCDGSCEEGDGSGNGQPCDGSCGKGNYPGRSIDDHGWMHESGKDEQDAAEAAGKNNPSTPDDLDRTKQDDNFKSNLNPGIGIGSKQEFSELMGVGLKWPELLEKINPFVFKRGPKPRASWHRPPRKLAAFPNTRLPVHKPGTEPGGRNMDAIVMALDTSGSIGEEQANQFVNMARSLPENKVKLFVCTFTNRYLELDLEDPKWESGGTDFDPISLYIDEVVMPHNRNRYPSAVVVVTDGYASFASGRPNEHEARAWYWLLTENGTDSYSEKLPGTIDALANFKKEPNR